MMEASVRLPADNKNSEKSIEEYKLIANTLTSLTLKQRHLCDIELLLNGGFFPLTGFMNQEDYHRVLTDMRLSDGTLWPIPITLDVDKHFAASIKRDDQIALRDQEGLLIAILIVEDCFPVDRKKEAQCVFETMDEKHPGVFYLNHDVKDFYIGGKLIRLSLPHHYDFQHLRHTPESLHEYFRARAIKKIVAFQTRNPMHRAHQELTRLAAQKTDAHLLLHPVVGMTKPGDIEYYTRVRCYEHILKTYPENSATLSLLPLAMRMAGPREALWHALIRKNYGCTHFIVGRDHAGPGKNSIGEFFYDPYAAQKLTLQYQKELGLEIIPFQEMVYSHKQRAYFSLDEFPKDETPATISGTELRDALQKGLDIPDWFSYPQVLAELRKTYPLKHQQGFTIFFTGLPSSGKSTLANALVLKLREITDREITLLDGDIIRTHLSQGLGFSQADREINITRVGFVAQEITRHGGVAICALVAPFARARNIVRNMISNVGGYIEVHVATMLAVCESRDRKGLYKKARQGLIQQFTGISDPYEKPEAAEIQVDTAFSNPDKLINDIVTYLKEHGYVL